VNEPVIVLADEATGNLDTKSSYEIMMLLQDLNREQGRTLIFVTHEADIAAFSNRTIVLKDGRIIRDTKNENVRLAREALAAMPIND
jgi:putative ABC transport system ATP-binding protein